jgi:4-aminobutyrate aminotransferase-like enzyme
VGAALLSRTRGLAERFDVVADVRGLGLMWGIEFRAPARPAARRVFNAVEARQPGLFSQLVAVPLFTRHRVLTQVAGHHVNVVKAIPPLVIGEEEVELFAGALEDVIDRAEHVPRAMTSLGWTMARQGLRARRPVAP